jgi:hypothetical protein
MKFEKVNDSTIKTLESVETVNPEIRKVIESLGGKVKSSTSSEIEASFRYGINFYGIIISVKIHRDNNETFIDIKGFFKDSIDNGAAALKATEILSLLASDIEQQKYIESPKGILENLTSKVKIAFEAYIVLFKKSPWLTGLATLFVIGVLLGESGSGGRSGGSERTPDGLTKAQWYERCEKYESAKQQCAVANNISRCIETKVGDVVSGMAGVYCKGNTPDFYLMGVK